MDTIQMKTFCLGDPHGGLEAVQQCFERSGIDKEKDRLICVGDTADGWPQAAETLEELLTISNLHYVMGNHDYWLLDYLETGATPRIWTSQGGFATVRSYAKNNHLKEKHREFYAAQPYYHVIDENLYVHGGFLDSYPIEADNNHNLMWDRDMWFDAMQGRQGYHGTLYKNIFIGHTTTSQITIDEPVNALNIWNVDQGGGHEGRLTMLDVNTKEFFQSDLVFTLYPDHKGR